MGNPTAMVITPVNGQWGVQFYTRQQGAVKQDWTMPMFYLPCRDYDHACKVCDAYRND